MKTRLIIISDTHIPKRSEWLPDSVLQQIRTSDYVLHAGDFTSLQFVDFLKQFPLIGVLGNRDESILAQIFPEKQLVNLNGYKIGLVHSGPGKGKNSLSKAMESFAGEKLDLLVFGHSHIPYLRRHGEMWVINPGSPTDPIKNNRRSYGIVELSDILEPKLFYF